MPGMNIEKLRNHFDIVAPIIAAFLATCGNGLYTTLTSLEIAGMSLSGWHTGVVFCMLYVGIMIGTYTAPKLIQCLGHVRSYLIFILMLSICTWLQAHTHQIYLWDVLRMLIGYAIGGSFVIYESWINTFAPPKLRAAILSFYFAVYYAALAIGQLFLQLPESSTSLYYHIVLGLTLCSMLPMLCVRGGQYHEFAHQSFAKNEWRRYLTLGHLGCWCSGVLCGILLTSMPYYLALAHYSQSVVAHFMLATISAGTIPQLFIGYLLQHVREKRLLQCSCLTTIMSALLFAWSSGHLPAPLWLAMGCAFILGASIFSIYPLCVALVLKDTPKAYITHTNSILLCAYGAGAAVGPLLCSIWMSTIGNTGFFQCIIGLAVVMVSASWYGKKPLSIVSACPRVK